MGYVSYGSLLYEQEDLVQPEATQGWYNFGKYLSLSTKVALVVKNLPANAGDVGSIPGSGRSPEEEIATHSCIIAWEIPWTEELGELQSMGSQRATHLND